MNPELGTFTTDEEGVLTAVVTIPEDTEPGEYTLTAVGLDSGITGQGTLTVTEPAGPGAAGGTDPAYAPGAKGPQGDELAATGMTARDAGLASGLLLLIGGGLAVLGYKNRIGRRGAEEA